MAYGLHLPASPAAPLRAAAATTPSYEARARGIFSALDLMKAARLAPDAFLLPADLDGAYSIIA